MLAWCDLKEFVEGLTNCAHYLKVPSLRNKKKSSKDRMDTKRFCGPPNQDPQLQWHHFFFLRPEAKRENKSGS